MCAGGAGGAGTREPRVRARARAHGAAAERARAAGRAARWLHAVDPGRRTRGTFKYHLVYKSRQLALS